MRIWLMCCKVILSACATYVQDRPVTGPDRLHLWKRCLKEFGNDPFEISSKFLRGLFLCGACVKLLGDVEGKHTGGFLFFVGVRCNAPVRVFRDGESLCVNKLLVQSATS